MHNRYNSSPMRNILSQPASPKSQPKKRDLDNFFESSYSIFEGKSPNLAKFGSKLKRSKSNLLLKNDRVGLKSQRNRKSVGVK